VSKFVVIEGLHLEDGTCACYLLPRAWVIGTSTLFGCGGITSSPVADDS